ncbi:MAG TPA: GFA family protein [Polyangiaceae bacterium]|nr:GFA family protein [Polyangiaceae bacterium]
MGQTESTTSTPNASEPRTYHGSCHCGAVKYDVDMTLDQLISCNCSICSRTGAILGFVTSDKFKLLSGEDALSDYQFKTKTIHHLFCKNCGVRSFGRGKNTDGTPMYAINVRCLDGVDVNQLKVQQFDGKSM